MGYERQPLVEKGGAGTLIHAADDVAVAKVWLERYRNSPHTFRAYEREVFRFLGWMKLYGLTFNKVMVEDATNYLRMLANPPDSLVGKKQRRSSDEWRPLNKPLSEKSRRHVQTVLISFYRYMSDAKYLTGNPFSLAERIPVSKAPLERYMQQAMWTRFTEFLSGSLPGQSGVTLEHAERCQWIFTFLYHTGARITEMAEARMGDFHVIEKQWWLRIRGKGGSVEDVPVSDLLLTALGRYRMSLNMAPLPSFGEATPVVMRVRGKAVLPLSAQGLHKIVKQVFQRFADELAAQGEQAQANHVLEMSAHWMRHTAATHQLAAGIPLLQVNKNLRHKKMETTLIYSHVEREERHDAMRNFGKPAT